MSHCFKRNKVNKTIDRQMDKSVASLPKYFREQNAQASHRAQKFIIVEIKAIKYSKNIQQGTYHIWSDLYNECDLP